MNRKTPFNVGASVRARLLKVSKERHEDFTPILMNYAAERFLYRLSQSPRRNEFVLKGAMLFAVRIGEPYRPTRDLDLLGTGEPSESAIEDAVRDITTTATDDDGVTFDVSTLQVHPIREDNRYGGIRAILQAHLAEARIHVQIDVGFGDAITPVVARVVHNRGSAAHQLGEEHLSPRALDDAAEARVLARDTDAGVQHHSRQKARLALREAFFRDGLNTFGEMHQSLVTFQRSLSGTCTRLTNH